MSLTPEAWVLFALIQLLFLLGGIMIGIQMGQGGVTRVERASRDEVRLQRHLKKVGRLIGDSQEDIDRIVAAALEDMRAAAGRDGSS